MEFNFTLRDIVQIAVSNGPTQKSVYASRYKNNVIYDACLEHFDDLAVSGSGGEYYVYLWKHAYGAPFYVGSGKGDRWLSKWRGLEFCRHIDHADAVVYKVLKNVDKETSLIGEKFLSLLFTLNGVPLVNGDNNASRKSPSASERAAKFFDDMLKDPLFSELKNSVLNKVLAEDKLPYLAALGRQEFLEVCGETYFTDAYKLRET